MPVAGNFPRRERASLDSLNCAYLCPFASGQPKSTTWRVCEEKTRETGQKPRETDSPQSTNALYPRSTASDTPVSPSFSLSLSLSIYLSIYLSLSLAIFLSFLFNRSSSSCVSEAYWSLGALWSTKGSGPSNVPSPSPQPPFPTRIHVPRREREERFHTRGYPPASKARSTPKFLSSRCPCLFADAGCRTEGK